MKRQRISSGSTFEAQIGYSRAVVAGDWVFVSGTTGFDYATTAMIISAGLADSRMKIEIEVTAIKQTSTDINP